MHSAFLLQWLRIFEMKATAGVALDVSDMAARHGLTERHEKISPS
jgi:hypothetical protein